jgi:iron complex transport system permease protein
VIAGRLPAAVLLPALTALLLGALLANAGVGAVRVAPLQVIAIVLNHLGIPVGVAYTDQQDAVIWAIRVPRILLAAFVGASLALAGAVMQGVFRNPLADPSLIGVSSGAALGAVVAILLGMSLAGPFSLPAAAFAGGLLATLAVYRLARHQGRVEVVTLVLTGIAVNAIAGAGIGLGTFLADDRQLRTIVFWSLGSVGGASWPTLLAALPGMALGLLVLPFFGRALNVLVLGDREARHLGLDTERLRFVLVTLAALATGAGVAVAGIIGFVGLVTPHVVRLLAGPDHRVLLPASALAGAVLLLLADLVSRTVVVPRELPLGVVTALAGGPFFLWLVQRTRAAHGGWG